MRVLPLGCLLVLTCVGACNCPGGPAGSSSGGGSSGGASSSSSGNVGDGGGATDASTVVDTPDPGRADNASRDSDCDGLSDAEEYGTVWPNGQHTDPANPDTDGDGLPDGLEVGRTSSVDPRCNGRFIPDGDPGATTDPTRADTDGDGLSDGAEDQNHDGVTSRTTETDPRNPDSDGDQLCDGPNTVTPVCTGGDPMPISAGMDADGDGLPDAVDTAPNNPDRDGDGLCDGPGTVAGVCVGGEDLDADGFVDAQETDPNRKDSDCDGLVDGPDVGAFKGERTLGTSPTNPDSDGDGLPDGLEAGITVAPDATCTSFIADTDPGTTTNPLQGDTDGDGVPDGAEDSNHNGHVDVGELDPNNPADGTGEVTTQQACGLEHLVAVDRQYVATADLQVLTAVKGADKFTETTTLTVPGPSGSRTAVGLMGFNATQGVAYLVFTGTPAGADVAAQEAAARTRLNGVGAVSTPISYQFTTWDGYAAAHGSYAMAGNVGVKARANAVARAFLTGVDGVLSAAQDISATGGFVVEAEYIRRSGMTAVTLIALLPADRATSSGRFTLSDLADGSAVGQYADALGVQCDRLSTGGYAAVDILWAVDNSASMAARQAAVAASGAAIQAKLNGATVDWRAAIVTSGFYQPGNGAGCTNASCGETLQQQCRPWTRDLAQFSRWMQQGQTQWIGAGGICNQAKEEIMQGAQLILSPAAGGRASFMPPTATEQANRLREHVNLLLIFVGDADDQFYTNATAAAGIDAYEAFLRGLPVESVTLGAISCPDGACGEAQRNPHVITGLVNRFGGVQGRLDVLASIGPTVDAILDSVIANVSPYRLSQPAVSSTLKVAMDANSTVGACNWSDVPRSRVDGFDYDARTRNLAFFGACRPDANQPNKRVAVSYRTWVDLTPDADPAPMPCGACSSCPGLSICNTTSCACMCTQALTCNTGFRWDAAACDCACDTGALNCQATHQANADLCACTCKPDCGGCSGATFCQTSLCECQTPGG